MRSGRSTKTEASKRRHLLTDEEMAALKFVHEWKVKKAAFGQTLARRLWGNLCRAATINAALREAAVQDHKNYLLAVKLSQKSDEQLASFEQQFGSEDHV